MVKWILWRMNMKILMLLVQYKVVGAEAIAGCEGEPFCDQNHLGSKVSLINITRASLSVKDTMPT